MIDSIDQYRMVDVVYIHEKISDGSHKRYIQIVMATHYEIYLSFVREYKVVISRKTYIDIFGNSILFYCYNI